MRRTLIVVGGGIAGLSAARRIARLSQERSLAVELVLIEAQPRLGGLIETEAREGALLEHGPDALSALKPWPAGYWESAGLAADILCAFGPGFRFPFFKRPVFSFRRGLGSLPTAYFQALPPGCRKTGRAVRVWQGIRGKWYVLLDDLSLLEADGVCLAVPAPAAAALLASWAPRLSQALSELSYCSVISLYMGYPARPGLSVPARIRFREGLAGAQKFPEHAPPDRRLVRVMLSWDEESSPLTDEAIVRRMQARLARKCGLRESPDFYCLRRHRRAVPRYGPGHSFWKRRIENLLRPWRGLALAGNAYDGVSVFSCVMSGERAAERLTDSLAP
ncbi:MAG: FAD-dependent oxidoreductase [Candidatus Omnitrophica bacterium]|nr:FAD-dependent oxidoreductase [Candidatus Omnitrophota bacterium]